ncbi:MAG: AMP-binding protein [Clostridia bacterium]|nr:AMP-binding protein [Clostridia bacterium]
MKHNYPYYEVSRINSIQDLLRQGVQEAGDKPVFQYKSRGNEVQTVTYREFDTETRALAAAIEALVEPNTHIAVIGENSYPWVTVYIAMLRSRNVIVPVDKELPLEDIIHVLSHSDSEILFFAKRYRKYMEALSAALPKIRYFIGFEEEADEGKILSYQKILSEGKTKPYQDVPHDITKMKAIVYTSGTTSLAKGVMLSEENLISMVYYGLRVSTIYTKCLSVLPYHHTYEAVAGLLVSMHKHACICINENMRMVLTNLQLYKPDYIYVVPAFLELFYKKIWANAAESNKAGLMRVMIVVSNALRKVGIDVRRKLFHSVHEAFGGNLIKIVTGGAPLRAELGKFFIDVGFDLINGYGITECSPLISANRDAFNDPETVGVPVECLEVRFENMASDGTGEICVKGKTVMLGYYKDEERTREVLRDGWFSTGDYGKMNQRGQLIITGRKKNLIVLKNGKNIFPEEIEGYIMQSPYVEEVIVRAMQDENGEESGLLAEVFLNQEAVEGIDDAEAALRKDISRLLMQLPPYKHITKIVIRDTAFEKTTTNKIKR